MEETVSGIDAGREGFNFMKSLYNAAHSMLNFDGFRVATRLRCCGISVFSQFYRFPFEEKQRGRAERVGRGLGNARCSGVIDRFTSVHRIYQRQLSVVCVFSCSITRLPSYFLFVPRSPVDSRRPSSSPLSPGHYQSLVQRKTSWFSRDESRIERSAI